MTGVQTCALPICAGRELLEDGEQRTGSVSPLEADDARPVVAGRGRDPASEEHEARLVVLVVLDPRGEAAQAVAAHRGPVRDRSRAGLLSKSFVRSSQMGLFVR